MVANNDVPHGPSSFQVHLSLSQGLDVSRTNPEPASPDCRETYLNQLHRAAGEAQASRFAHSYWVSKLDWPPDFAEFVHSIHSHGPSDHQLKEMMGSEDGKVLSPDRD